MSIESIIEDYDDKYFENLQMHSTDTFKYIKKALDIAKNFIIERKLILYGGIAIDYALKKKGSKLYDEDTLPDYDVLSSQHAKDAYDLGCILQKEGLPNISVIYALHIQTMKVRVEYETIMDCSYVKHDILSGIPTMEYNKFLLVHPNYQMIDLHRGMAFPFNDFPKEVIFHRQKKDLVRYNMLFEKYPLKEIQIKNKMFKKEFKYNDSMILIGISAYCALQNKLTKVADTITIEYVSDTELPIECIDYGYSSNIHNDTNIDDKSNKSGDASIYREHRGDMPIIYKKNGILYHDYRNHILCFNKINGINVMNIQFLLEHMLVEWHLSKKDIYLNLYTTLLKHYPIPFPDEIKECGTNINESYALILQEQKNKKYKTNNAELSNIRPKMDTELSNIRPKNFFPKKEGECIPPIFDYNSIYFK
jgi:hypothetical protein